MQTKSELKLIIILDICSEIIEANARLQLRIKRNKKLQKLTTGSFKVFDGCVKPAVASDLDIASLKVTIEPEVRGPTECLWVDDNDGLLANNSKRVKVARQQLQTLAHCHLSKVHYNIVTGGEKL